MAGGAAGCHYDDNLRWTQWWQSWHYDSCRFQVLYLWSSEHQNYDCNILPLATIFWTWISYYRVLTHWLLEIWMNFRHVIFKPILMIDGWGISCETALIWMSLDFTDYQSTLVQVMAWCHQATSHYLNQCWPTSLSPHGITRPQWVR